MANPLDILNDPNYTNANQATKQAIFNKHVANNPAYANANSATKAAIQSKYGLGQVSAPMPITPTTATIAPGSKGILGALARGTGSAISGIGTALEDIQGAEKAGQGMHTFGQKMVEENPARYGSIKDIKNVGDVLGFGGEKVLEMLPQVGATIGGGLLAGAAAPEVALASAIGAGITGAGITFGQQYGETRETQKEKGIDDRGRAAATAAVSAGLDVGTGVGAKLVKGFLKKTGEEVVKDTLIKEGKKSLVKETLKTAGEEGLTEIGQQALQRYGGYQPLTGAEAMEEYATSGLGGVLGGGILGGGITAVQQYNENAAQREEELKQEALKSALENRILADEQEAKAKIEGKPKAKKAAVEAEQVEVMTVPAGPVQAIVEAKTIPARLKASKEALSDLVNNDDRFVGVEVPADIYDDAAKQLAQMQHGSDPFVALSTLMAKAGLPLKQTEGATDVAGVPDTGGLAAGVSDIGTEGAAVVGQPAGVGTEGLESAGEPAVGAALREEPLDSTLVDKAVLSATSKASKKEKTALAKEKVDAVIEANPTLANLPAKDKTKLGNLAKNQLALGQHDADAVTALNSVLVATNIEAAPIQPAAQKVQKADVSAAPAVPKEGPTQAEKNAALNTAKAIQTAETATLAGVATPKTTIAPEVGTEEAAPEVSTEEVAPEVDPYAADLKAIDDYEEALAEHNKEVPEDSKKIVNALRSMVEGYSAQLASGATPVVLPGGMINLVTKAAAAARIPAPAKATEEAAAPAGLPAREKRYEERKTDAWQEAYAAKSDEGRALDDLQAELDDLGLNFEVVSLPNNKTYPFGFKPDPGVGGPRGIIGRSKSLEGLRDAVYAHLDPTISRIKGRPKAISKGPITTISEGTAQGAVKPASGRIAANEKEDVTGLEVPVTAAQRAQQFATKLVDNARLGNKINDAQQQKLLSLVRNGMDVKAVRAALIVAANDVRQGKVSAPTRTTEGMATTQMTNVGQLYENLTRRGFFAGVAGSAISSVVSAATLPRTSVNSNAAIKNAINSGSLQTAIEAIRDHSTNPAYKAIARILALGGLGDTKVIVEDYGDEELAVAGETNSTSGDVTLYKTSNGMSGDTLETLLHEAIHSYIATRYMNLSTYLPSNRAKLNTAVKHGDEFVDGFNDLWRTFTQDINMRAAEGDRDIRNLINGETGEVWMVEAMRSPDELLVRSLVDPDLQAFLKSIDITGRRVSDPNVKTVWDKIVDMIAKLFGITIKPEKTALATLMDAGNSLLKAAALDAPNKEFAQAAHEYMAEHEAVRNQFERKKKKLTATKRKIETSTNVMKQTTTVFTLFKESRNINDVLNILKGVWDGLDIAAIRMIFPMMTTDDISEWAKGKVKNIANINNTIEDLGTRRFELIQKLAEKIPAWIKYNQESKDGGVNLAATMHFATLEDVDMAAHANLGAALRNDKKLLKLKKEGASQGQINARANRITEGYELWEQLSPEGKAIYKMARDSYLETFDTHMKLLVGKVENSNATKERKDRAIKSIKDQFAAVRDQGTYFPLMRYGKYWYRVGVGKNSKFFMFESAALRNIAMAKEATEYAAENGNRTIKQMKEDGHLDQGDNLIDIRQEILGKAQTSQMLKEIFDLLEDKSGTPINPQDMKKIIEDIKDQVFQMYLMTLPDKDMRKRFTHRTGKEGFTADVLRNFITSQHTATNQLSRLEYADKIRNQISQAYGELKNNPDKLRLTLFVDEISKRATAEISPAENNDQIIDFDKLASLGNTAVFMWMLTAPKSALIQFTQLPIVGLPVLTAMYGPVKTAAMTTNYMNFINKVTLSKEGPSFSNSEYVEKHKNSDALKFAYQYATKRGLFMSTYAADLTARGAKPTDVYESTANKATRTIANMMTGAFHHMERMNREVMFMSAFELELNKLQGSNMTKEAMQEAAARKAMSLTYESLFNYSAYNKPRAFKHPVGKITFQFMTYPLQMGMFLMKNGLDTIRKQKTKEERKAAAIKFFGTLGMTWMFAGAVGMPFYTMMMGLVDGARDLLRPDPDDDDADGWYDDDDDGNPLGKRSADLWFREWFIPHYFGPDSSLAESLGLTEEQGFLLERAIKMGPISAVTDVNLGASTSLDSLFFANDTPAKTSKAAFQDMLIKSAFGPLGGLGLQGAAAFDDFNTGHGDRGVEKLLPAFFRGPVVTARLHAEGSLTRDGAEMKSAEFFTTGKLLAQSLGFGNTTVAEIQKKNILAKQMVGSIATNRTKLLEKLDRVIQQYDNNPTDSNEAAIDKAYEDIRTFNVKNNINYFQIGNDDILESISSRSERRVEAISGLSVDEKLMPIVSALVGPTGEE